MGSSATKVKDVVFLRRCIVSGMKHLELTFDSGGGVRLALVVCAGCELRSADLAELAEEDLAADSTDLAALAGGDLDLAMDRADAAALAAGDFDRATDSAGLAALAAGDFDLSGIR